MRERQGGFTLLELLTVVIIVALLAASVQLTRVGGDPARRLADEAAPLLRVFELQCRQARLVNSDRAIGLLENGWMALERGDNGQWQAEQSDGMFRPRMLAGDVRWTLLLEGRPVRLPEEPDEPPQAHLRCRPGGWTDDFRLTLAIRDENEQLILSSSGDGQVEVEEAS